MIDQEIDENGPGEFETVRLNPSNRSRAKLTFFYKKKDDEIFAAEEQESANGKYWKKFEYVGWSNGQTYIDTINSAKLKTGQLVSKEEAGKLLQSAFDAELAVAKQNMKEARDLNRPVPRPQRVEWSFDSSVPMQERQGITHGKYDNL